MGTRCIPCGVPLSNCHVMCDYYSLCNVSSRACIARTGDEIARESARTRASRGVFVELQMLGGEKKRTMRDSVGCLTLGRGKKRNECKAGRKSSRKPTRSFAYTRPTSQIPLHFFDTLLHTSTCTRLFSAPYSFPLLFKRAVSSAFSFLQRIRSSLMPPYHYGYDIRHTRQTTSGYSIETTSYPALTGNAFFPRASACDDKKWGENFSSPEWDTFGRVAEYLFLLFEDVLVNRRLM